MGANPHANGGKLAVDLDLPDFRAHAIPVTQPATEAARIDPPVGQDSARPLQAKRATEELSAFLPRRDELEPAWRSLCSRERCSVDKIIPTDDHVAPDGRVMEVLSEHLCQGWLEGYVQMGRHGLFVTYEAFAMVTTSMTVQHTKWLEEAIKLPWRKPIPSLNLLLTSTCWRNDHNGFSHQGPGLIDTVLSMKGTVARIYSPPDANCLLYKQPELQWLDMDTAVQHCAAGASVWPWASNDQGGEPDVVLAQPGTLQRWK
jgi:xylulose-5-phosphate/fructose-6-phosphate phosphoketolase